MTQAHSSAEDKTLSIIDQFLLDQASLTAVSQFARSHESGIHSPRDRYRELLPLHAPRPGEQYAFEVDLDLCSGCKACVTACHALNGLDDDEVWRNVQVIRGVTRKQPVLQTITSACHHCEDPACLNGCPVLAYEKDSATGIVRHLDDQCIGCQYCVLKCPYDVPKYSAARGIVRKCDMCSNRLAEGEAPACVQACPNEAIQITVVGTADPLKYRTHPENNLLNDTVSASYTLPTTRYISQKGLPSASAIEPEDPRPEPAHTPLILMLVFTQMALGVFSAEYLVHIVSPVRVPNASFFAQAVGLASCFIGLAASVFHLGRPRYAWKAFLNWRKSWLSREVIAFGIFASFCLAAFLLLIFAKMNLSSPVPAWVPPAFHTGVIVSGLAGVFCSAMLYADTRRPFWSLDRSAAKFYGSAVVLGCGALFALHYRDLPIPAPLLLIGATLLKLGFEIRELTQPRSDIAASSFLMRGPLGPITRTRLFCSICGGLLIPALALISEATFLSSAIAFVLCLAGELLERALFFKAVVRWKMPGSQ